MNKFLVVSQDETVIVEALEWETAWWIAIGRFGEQLVSITRLSNLPFPNVG